MWRDDPCMRVGSFWPNRGVECGWFAPLKVLLCKALYQIVYLKLLQYLSIVIRFIIILGIFINILYNS